MNSPELHLAATESDIRKLLFGIFCFAGFGMCYRLVALDYGVLALVVLLLMGPVFVLWYEDPAAGECLCWRYGRWYLLSKSGLEQPVAVQSDSLCVAGLICVRWRSQLSPARGTLWLYPDSADPEALRYLRVRLRLDG